MKVSYAIKNKEIKPYIYITMGKQMIYEVKITWIHITIR